MAKSSLVALSGDLEKNIAREPCQYRDEHNWRGRTEARFPVNGHGMAWHSPSDVTKDRTNMMLIYSACGQHSIDRSWRPYLRRLRLLPAFCTLKFLVYQN